MSFELDGAVGCAVRQYYSGASSMMGWHLLGRVGSGITIGTLRRELLRQL